MMQEQKVQLEQTDNQQQDQQMKEKSTDSHHHQIVSELDEIDALLNDTESTNGQHEYQEEADVSLMKVFECLGYDDLLIVNRVCKKWSELVCKLVEDKVVVMKKYGDLNRRPIKLLSIPNLIATEDQLYGYSFVQFRLDKEVHKRIKRLVTYNPFIFEGLNFDNLLNLEIRESSKTCIEGHNDPNLIEIKFRNLKYLNVDVHAHCSFKITAPKLLAAKFSFDFRLVNLVIPNSLRFLHCYRISNQLLLLKNLRSLSIETLNYEKANYNLFKKLPKLKTLYMYDSTRKSFDKLLTHKREQKAKVGIFLNGINVSMNGFNFDYVKNLNLVFDESKYAFYKRNQQHVDGELIHKSFRIEKNLKVDMDLLAKFSCIRILNVLTEKISLNNWIKLLKTLNLKRLFINAYLSQNYLEPISKFQPNLKWLHLQDYDDISFIFSLRYLENVRFDNLIHLEEFNQLVGALKFIKQIEFEVYDGYRFEFNDRSVSLFFGERLLFKESRDLFFNYTLKMIDSWSTLFKQDGSAVCESKSEVLNF